MEAGRPHSWRNWHQDEATARWKGCGCFWGLLGSGTVLLPQKCCIIESPEQENAVRSSHSKLISLHHSSNLLIALKKLPPVDGNSHTSSCAVFGACLHSNIFFNPLFLPHFSKLLFRV